MTPATASPSLVERIDEILKWDGAWYANAGRRTGEKVCALLREIREALTVAPAPEDAELVREARLRIDHHRYMAKVAREYACGEDAEESDRDADLLDALADRLSRPASVFTPEKNEL